MKVKGLKGVIVNLAAAGAFLIPVGCEGEDAVGVEGCQGLQPVGASCINGVWTCPPAQPTICGAAPGVCVDTKTDSNHCGGCGISCGGGRCINGMCAAAEECDGRDNDGDTQIDEGLTRSCSSVCGTGTETCVSGQWRDCTAPQPQPEVCDNVDNNCNGQVDEGVRTPYYRDSDNDGYGDPNSRQEACSAPAGYVGNNTDCNDADRNTRPGGAETCNRTDDDCDGQVDEGFLEDSYEGNDTCGTARVLQTAVEGGGRLSVMDATLYSTDGSDDTDWYTIETNEATHVECFLNPLGRQCYFFFKVSLTPPSGVNPRNWSFCVHVGNCGNFEESVCTNETHWEGEAYSMTMQWEGTCGIEDGKILHVEVGGAAGERDCRPYKLEYEFLFEGGIGDEYCTP